MATNKASGLTAHINTTSADALEVKGERFIIDAWFMRYNDMEKRGMTPDKYAKAYRNDTKRVTDYSASTMSQYLGAIKRAVKKYGTTEKAVKAYLVESRREYVEIFYFIKWAPAGQRAKNDTKKPAPATAITLTASEAHKRLAKYPKAMRDDIIAELGLK